MRALSLLLLALPAADAAAQIRIEYPAQSVPGEYVVELEAAGTRPESLGFERAGAGVVARSPLGGFALVRQRSTESLGPTGDLERLERLPGVRSVRPNHINYLTLQPNDPEAGKLWMIPAIGAAHAWAIHADASPVTVAVIDSGIYLDHEDLRDNLWTNAGEIPGNGVDDDGNGFADDMHGWDFGDGDADPNPIPGCSGVRDGQIESGSHGTHVAGTVGAVGGNGIGVIGVAPRVRIMALKVSRKDLHCAQVDTFSRYASLEYAIKNGAKIVNMSLSGPGRDSLDLKLLEIAAQNDVLVVVAASNDGLDNDTPGPYGAAFMRDGQIVYLAIAPQFPAAWDTATLLTVAATREAPAGQPAVFVDAWNPGEAYTGRVTGLAYDQHGRIDFAAAEYVPVAAGAMPRGSNFGRYKVHIAAPGADILSTSPAVSGAAMSSAYAWAGGTSMASPTVAGAAALLWSAFPEMTAVEVKRRLMATVAPSPDLADRVQSGGQLDILAALCAPGAPRVLPGCGGGQGPAKRSEPPATTGTPRTTPLGPATTAAPAAPDGGAQNLNKVITW